MIISHLVHGTLALSRAHFGLLTSIRMLVFLVLGIALPTAAMAGSQPFEMDAVASTDVTFDAVLDTIQELRWKATVVTKKSGMIMFSTGQWLLSGKARCTVIVVDGEQPGTALVHLAVNHDRVSGFATNDFVADRLFSQVKARLESSGQPLAVAAAVGSGTSALASQTLSPTCSPQNNCTISALLTATTNR